MALINVGVLRGGPSSEYDVSLKSGAVVLKHLSPEKYRPLDIFIDKQGRWHIRGFEIEPHKALHKVDVIFNALHGEYGEDGKVQQFLETHGVPFTGSGTLGSAIGMNKELSKKIFIQHGLKTPHYFTVRKDEFHKGELINIFRTFPIPAVVKPMSAGSSVGVTIATTLHELENGIVAAFNFGDTVLIEEFIPGVEATCGVVEHFRGEAVHALIPVEIRPKKSHFFDYESKYSDGGSEEICPGNFTLEEKRLLENYAKVAHKALGLAHYSRSDFIVNPRRGIYILETNTLPGLTEASLLPKALKAGGTELHQFLDHVVELAMGRKR